MTTLLASPLRQTLLCAALFLVSGQAQSQSSSQPPSPPAVPAAQRASASEAAGGGLYVGLGSTGLVLGYGQTVNPSLGSRFEAAGLPRISRSLTEGGIDYRAQWSMRRLGATLDWHPFSNGFRLSAGLSWVDAALNLDAHAVPGALIVVGNVAVPVGPADGLSARVELPRTMPYVGLGWGRGLAQGWSLNADLGALVGKARVTGTLTASLRSKIQLAGFDPDAELSRELAPVRDRVDRLPVYPVLQLALNYRW
jgi:hypothetical protein